MYYSLDLANASRDVADVVEIHLKISSRQRGEKRSYLFLDEASSVAGWQKGIKWLVGGDKLKKNCTVLVTGSQAINIQNAAERLPGRKGVINDAYDKILFPMKFAEYASLLSKDIKELIEKNSLFSFKNREAIFRKLVTKEIDERLDKINAHQNETNDLLMEYMATGGILRVVDEKIRANTIHEGTYTNYLEGIRGQWGELGKNETLLRQFAGAIIKSLTSHISWNGLAKEAALGGGNTAQEYAHALHDLSVLSIIQLYGEQENPHDPKRQKVLLS